MIIEALLNVLYTAFRLLLMPIDIPNLPPEVQQTISEIFTYISGGLGILGEFLDLDYLLTLFGLVLAVDIGMMLYKLVMFVMRKIPFLGIK